MKLNSFKIGNLEVKTPIIQGGMGVGVSRAHLAAAVANEGGIGTLSGVHIGYDEPDFETNTMEANFRALRSQIRKARELSPNGILAVNFMVAMNKYDEHVKIAIEEGIDLIVSGAGLPVHLPALVEGSNTKIAPIASSGRTANVICKLWDKRHNRIPDLLVLEGPKAGGHLGFHLDDLAKGKEPSIDSLLLEVLEAIKPFEEKYNKKIPVAVAGGIFTGDDIARVIKLGASAVQMGTRFIGTIECDADIKFKEMLVNAKEEDIEIVVSPVGLPGRAVINKFMSKIKEEPEKITKCYNCLKPCNPAKTPYCISKALINAVKGDVDNALIFTGSNGYKIDKIVSVKELITELVTDANNCN